MRVCFLSESPQNLNLNDFDSCAGALYVPPNSIIPDADLYVWDYIPEIGWEAEISARRNRLHLILVESQHLHRVAALRSWTCILLKPVSAFTLKAFVDLALETPALYQSPASDHRQLAGNAFVQYLLGVNLKLQQHDQERNNFLARILHDLRTPLTALHGYCGLLARRKLGAISSAQQELLERMQYSASRLMRLTTGTFTLLTENRCRGLSNCSPGDIGETFRRALHDVDPFIREKHIQVAAEIQPPGAKIPFEPEQIQQVFVNLLENSCKFIPANGRIEIRGYLCAGDSRTERQRRLTGRHQRATTGYRIDINDSGPGIPPELTEKIFEQYVSYAEPSDRSSGGLGLAICRRIMSAHRGAIWATPSQTGGCFSFVLPLGNGNCNLGRPWNETLPAVDETVSLR